MEQHEETRPEATGVAAGEQDNGRSAAWAPYQPSLDAGISVEWDHKNARRIELAKKKARHTLPAEEEAEFQALQKDFFAYLESKSSPQAPDAGNCHDEPDGSLRP
jgi:hypothetical protein